MAPRRRCGAYCRSTNDRCRRWPVKGRKRCRLHAGLSTGPRTPEGKARSIANLKIAYAKRAADSAAGRPHGGRRKGAKWVTESMWRKRMVELLYLPDDPAKALEIIQQRVDEYKKAHKGE